MRRFFTLFRHQVHMMMIAPSTYVAAFLFIVFMIFIYILGLLELSENATSSTPLEKFLSIFWVPVLFIVPLLTMRSLAEEKKTGTLDTLLTTPVSIFQVVLSKFLASYLYYSLLWALTLFFPLLTVISMPHALADDRLFSLSQTLAGYSFILASGLSYIAIGIFASSLTRTTLVAGMLSFCMLFCMIIGGGLIIKFSPPDTGWLSWMSGVADYIQTFKQLEDFSSGVLDTRPFFFYGSVSILLLAITTLVMDARR